MSLNLKCVTMSSQNITNGPSEVGISEFRSQKYKFIAEEKWLKLYNFQTNYEHYIIIS